MDSLIRDARALFDLALDADQVAALTLYERELLEWNQKFNLTAIRDSESIRSKHFLDSFSCTLAWKSNRPLRLLDLGTGAGFPGIPLKIIQPSMHLTLVESVGKKVKFCEHIVALLRLGGVEVIHARAEDLAHDRAHRESYDWAVARAVAKLNVVSEYLLPFVKIGGYMLAQRGHDAAVEAHASEKAMSLLGAELRQVISVQLPGIEESRYLVVAEKVSATPEKYPRKAGVPAKTPL